jgi:leucyl-tRNA synthetase
LGHAESVTKQAFPAFDAAKLVQDEVEIVIQVNSKVRSKAVVPMDAEQAVVERIALADPQIVKFIDGKDVKKIIFVQNKIFNVILG